MGRPGSAPGNAVIEFWHSALEFEQRAREHFATRAQARARVAEWIEDTNTVRRHSAIAMMSPVAFELAQARNQAARPRRVRCAGHTPNEAASPPLTCRSARRARGRPSGRKAAARRGRDAAAAAPAGRP